MDFLENICYNFWINPNSLGHSGNFSMCPALLFKQTIEDAAMKTEDCFLGGVSGWRQQELRRGCRF